MLSPIPNQLPTSAGFYGEWVWNGMSTAMWNASSPLEVGVSLRHVRDQGYASLPDGVYLLEVLDRFGGSGLREGGYLELAAGLRAAALHRPAPAGPPSATMSPPFAVRLHLLRPDTVHHVIRWSAAQHPDRGADLTAGSRRPADTLYATAASSASATTYLCRVLQSRRPRPAVPTAGGCAPGERQSGRTAAESAILIHCAGIHGPGDLFAARHGESSDRVGLLRVRPYRHARG